MLDTVSPATGETPLNHAARVGSAPSITMLLEAVDIAGYDTDAKARMVMEPSGGKGHSPLHGVLQAAGGNDGLVQRMMAVLGEANIPPEQMQTWLTARTCAAFL